MMHMANPGLTTTGKKRGKQKFRSAAAAQQAREVEAGWADLQKKWQVDAQAASKTRALKAKPYVPPKLAYRGSDEQRVASLNTGWHTCAKTPDKVYTGDKIIGISQMAKSNAVPVFNQQAAIDIARMRRG